MIGILGCKAIGVGNWAPRAQKAREVGPLRPNGLLEDGLCKPNMLRMLTIVPLKDQWAWGVGPGEAQWAL